MLKLFLIIAGVVLVGFLIVDESYNVSVSTMGYEYSFSIVVLFVGIVVLFYLIHFLKKPFRWLADWKARRYQKNILRKESFLTLVLTTALDQNNLAADAILSKKKSLFAKGSTESLLFDALFAPTPAIFEKLRQNKQTELAGIHGLFMDAKKKGDIDAQTQLLENGLTLYPDVLWLLKEQLDLQLLQDDFANALVSLEALNKRKAIDKAVYSSQKACILYKQGDLKEAFDLAPENPTIAISYATATPKKAEDVLKKSWNLTPCWDTYLAYHTLIKAEPAAKQMKLIDKFVSKNPQGKMALLAVTDMAISNNLWGVAKETLDIAIKSFPLNHQMATMMATIERKGWHHEFIAKEWDEKAGNAENNPTWMCNTCNHTTGEWDVKCPVCNACGNTFYHV